MDLKEQITNLKETIEDLQKKVKDLEKSYEKSYELPKIDNYYHIQYNPVKGKFTSGEFHSELIPKEYNDNNYKSGNYFSSNIDAENFTSILNTLLTISKYKRIIEPNTNLDSGTWTIARHTKEGWIPMKEMALFKNPYIIYFITKEHCKEVCDILNREDVRC